MIASPLYWASLLFVFGLFSASFFLHGEGVASFVAIIVAIGIASAAARAKGRNVALLCCLIWAAGVTYYTLYDQMNQTRLGHAFERQVVEGRIVSSVNVDGDRARFTFRIKKIGKSIVNEKVEADLLLKDIIEYEMAQSLRYGSSLTLIASLQSPERPRNPGAMDYKQYLYYQRIHWTLKAEFPPDVRIEPASVFHPLYQLDRFQKKLAQIANDAFPPVPGSIVKGLVLGMRADIPSEIADAYAKLGLAHLLAISGLHMTILIGGLLMFGEFIGLTREKKLLFAIVFIPCYTLLVGASPSVARAGIMAIAVLFAHYLRRTRDGLNFWGLACIVLLLINPYQIWNIAFQLSFLVTWGLLTLTAPLARRIPLKSAPIRSMLAVTLSAELASTPIILYYFNQYNILSPLLNFVFVPLFSFIIIPLSFVCMVLGLIHPSLIYLLSSFLSRSLTVVDAILGWAVSLKSFQFYFSSPAVWWCVLYYVAFSMLPFVLRREKKSYPYFLGATVILCLPLFSSQEEKVVITFLDVGQGDAIVVETPPDRVYLIDGGGALPFFYEEEDAWRARRERYDPGRKVVVPFLKSRGINRIDAVFMTHGDADHIGGLFAVLKEMKVDRLVGNGREHDTELEQQLIAYAQDLRIPLKWGKRGDRWRDTESVHWSIWHPGEERSIGSSRNDQSIVLLLEAYGKRILFTGDLEFEGELQLLALPLPTPIDALKVAHHGSRTSTRQQWVDELRPTLAVISAGRANRYGHPHENTILNLEERGVHIFRTDEAGSITIEITKDHWKVTTALQH